MCSFVCRRVLHVRVRLGVRVCMCACACVCVCRLCVCLCLSAFALTILLRTRSLSVGLGGCACILCVRLCHSCPSDCCLNSECRFSTTCLQGNTPVMLAIKLGRMKCASVLIAAGASLKVEARDALGWETTQEAARTQNAELARMVWRE